MLTQAAKNFKKTFYQSLSAVRIDEFPVLFHNLQDTLVLIFIPCKELVEVLTQLNTALGQVVDYLQVSNDSLSPWYASA